MANISENMTLRHVYDEVNSILQNASSVADYLNALSIVELFCQTHDDHYFVLDTCNIDLNTLHQLALSGLCSCLFSTITDKAKECFGILEGYIEEVGE